MSIHEDVVYDIEYCLHFYKIDPKSVVVKFVCKMNESDIDKICFLLAEYYDQKSAFNFKGLTFFSQFSYVIDAIKKDYEQRNESDDEVKKIFKIFLENDFIKQVPSFNSIIGKLKPYYKTAKLVQLSEIKCNVCVDKLDCLACKAAYVSKGISLMDIELQNGWDIYFRPMLGLPLIFFVLFKSDLSGVDTEVFNVNNIITNLLLQFFYNLLCDKATPLYWNFDKCKPLIDNCQKYILGFKDDAFEYLLVGLNTSSYNSKLYAPLKQFMEQHYPTKQIGRLVHKLFIGFFMRVYFEARKQKKVRSYDLEIRNVCRAVFNDYSDAEFESLISKLENIKKDLAYEISTNLILPKELVMQLFNRNDLQNDITKLLNKSVNLL
ncbi:PxORF63 peptide [Plutella xylostella granulovirus]|jgi:hypothetical protein|uniref:PlxyGVORF63 protein n=1 Tax=Plutella xylostella granulovirus TaxID=98383 RepID=Q9DVX0_9BBAC|nr:PxORF63 peptide [Plutella xylostella granulovirus]AAG27361.1 PxORF63 peptide [Plutella xylostella granulovirus]ANY57582.1 PlxyGVORF63 protein [Plutella xylostella granulovirus]